MGYDRINAAYAMIDSIDPDRSKRLKWDGQFYDASGGEISACLAKARQTGKDQKCTVTVAEVSSCRGLRDFCDKEE